VKGHGGLHHRPKVVALVGSPRRQGNTASAVGVATQELERRGVDCETIMLCDFTPDLLAADLDQKMSTGAEECAEALIDRIWAADGLILATPIYFCTMSAHMKAFMDRTNDRYLDKRWLTPRAVGLLAIGAQAGFTETIAAMRRYLDLLAPSHPPVEVATGHAEAIGEALGSREVREAARTMAARMADVLLSGSVNDEVRGLD
jgi:multimeric flavodoxin WrbA